jgi:spoIIIJ-associated protein
MPRNFDPEHDRDPRAQKPDPGPAVRRPDSRPLFASDSPDHPRPDLLPDPEEPSDPDDLADQGEDLEAPEDAADAAGDGDESPPAEEDLGEPEVAEAVGATIEEAIQNAIEILGAREDEVEIQILEEGHRPFLGLGRRRLFRVRATWREDLDEEVIEEEVPDEEARVPARRGLAPAPPQPPRPPASRTADPSASRPAVPPARTPPADDSTGALEALAAHAREVTEDLLRRMGIQAIVRAAACEGEVRVDVESDTDEALLIGHRGEARAALQHIVQRLVTPRDERGTPVLLDVNGYWTRRVAQLRQDALELAREAFEQNREVRTEPLSAQERRVIHRALADDNHVRTESLGEGALKRVAILPAAFEE